MREESMRILADEQRVVIGRAGQGAATFSGFVGSAIYRTYVPPFDMIPATTQGSCNQNIFRKHVGESLVDRCSDVIEFRDERVFEPVNHHFGDDYE